MPHHPLSLTHPFNPLAIACVAAVLAISPASATKPHTPTTAAPTTTSAPAPTTTPAATTTAGGACYTKTDGKPSAFDEIDPTHKGTITQDQVAAFYKAKYATLTADEKKKATEEKYISNHTAYFKGIDKNKDNNITCEEYKASISHLGHKKPATTAPGTAPAPH